MGSTFTYRGGEYSYSDWMNAAKQETGETNHIADLANTFSQLLPSWQVRFWNQLCQLETDYPEARAKLLLTCADELTFAQPQSFAILRRYANEHWYEHGIWDGVLTALREQEIVFTPTFLQA